ncbi:DUF418 domain-containing protein [Shewanella schlegeliana]|uniref:DUF418 domain-containing protein n=1 Tax=Shewanella schlegeliana TaxID=190308 RepID=A0ABS1T161_9GAMM|nr:DUF418 domain-containing protein [Shewanella schlegeliana]MBL4914533.1 DUF418 domain-containing protein [Shewanella schlegeliana]MCL1109651.1 DUF418 domain-containing protein [Shewanella schlegeliana]GIU30087.1 DUF418 domain-containing protein [Shewanella schlegeliana]
MELSTQTHSQAASTSSSTNSTKRNANLDAIRGLAVLGILFINIYSFGNGFSGYVNHAVIPWYDTAIDIFNSFFIEARFLSLFAILFGAGLATQSEKILNSNQANQMKSRLKWLMLFGALHATFIWFGDILFAYGVSGLLTLCYISLSQQKILRKAGLFWAIGLISLILMTVFLSEPFPLRESPEAAFQYQLWTGPYLSQLIEQVILFLAIAVTTPLTSMWFASGLMLLGVYLYRAGGFEQGFNRKQLLRLIIAALVFSGIDSFCSLSSSELLQNLSPAIVVFSALPTALIYIHIVVKLCQNRANFFKPLQNVGRLALSLYILQSIVISLLFRYFAPTLLLALDRPGYMAIAIGFSLIQLLIASLYLKYFNQGPLEWLWRALSSRKTIEPSSKPITSS